MNIIFLVHGTWGMGEFSWYQPDAKSNGFPETLKKEWNIRGIQEDAFEFVPFEWSGHNTHAARDEGGKALASKLLEISEQQSDAKFYFIAHSHGGNVVLKALEIYLNQRPADITPQTIDTRDTIEQSRRFLRDYLDGRFQFKSDPKELKKLINKLKNSLESIDSREFKRFRFSLGDGSIYDIEKGGLKHTLARLYRHIFTLPQYHQIGGVVTLGTPFYEKRWKLTQLNTLKHRSMHVVFYIPLALAAVYFYGIFFNGILALTPWVSWAGFSPLNWQAMYVGIALGVAAFFLFGIANPKKMESPVNTNVYFDEATIPYYLQMLQGDYICRFLNIHSGLLDEAYCLLAAYPILIEQISKYLKIATKPKVWSYSAPVRIAGFWHKSPAAMMQYYLNHLVAFVLSVVLLAIYPVRRLIHAFGSLYIGRILRRQIRSLAYGLPEDEFNESSEITVHSTIQKGFFKSEAFEVARELSMHETSIKKSLEQFKFLWDDDDMRDRVSHSRILKRLNESFNPDQTKQIISLEERVKEYYGIVGIRHSMYYENESVTRQVAGFLAECFQRSEVETPSHIHNIPRRPF